MLPKGCTGDSDLYKSRHELFGSRRKHKGGIRHRDEIPSVWHPQKTRDPQLMRISQIVGRCLYTRRGEMHFILGLLGTIVTILILLNRLAEAGIDLGGLNPFLWHRRRKWRKMSEGASLFHIASPMDATAILMVAAVKADGDMTKEDKANLLNIFETEFHLSKKDAADLLVSSVHLLGDGKELRRKVHKFLEPSRGSFSEEQAQSAIALVSRAAGSTEERHENATELLEQVEILLTPKPAKQTVW